MSGSVEAVPPATACKRSVGAQRAPGESRAGRADRRSLEPLRFGRRRRGVGGPGGKAGSPGNGAARA